MKDIKSILQNAASILIGAGAGLSTSSGFTYSGERFKKYFADFEKKYGFHDMYSGGFTAFESLEENWAYWSRQIYLNRFVKAPLPVYEKLLELVKEKTILSLRPMLTTAFKRRALINLVFSTLRVITDSGSVHSLVTRKLMITSCLLKK